MRVEPPIVISSAGYSLTSRTTHSYRGVYATLDNSTPTLEVRLSQRGKDEPWRIAYAEGICCAADEKSCFAEDQSGGWKGHNPVAPERVAEILKRLDATYPNVSAHCITTARGNCWWQRISAQCTDVRVNMVTPIIFAKYPTPQHFAALNPEELEPDIRSTGFFRNKAKSIVGAAKKLFNEFGGKVPETDGGAPDRSRCGAENRE